MPDIRTITKIDANPLLTSKKNEYRQLNVAAYCRVSTDSEDQLQSYSAQVEYYTEHISKNPKWHLVKIYADEGITGTSISKREDFKKMIKDCEKGKIDLILTKSVSRFARNTVDSLNYVRRLKAMGVGVYFEEQNIDTRKTDSEMFVGLYSVIAQSESENISANVRWGIQQRMKNGTFAFRFNVYGYRKGADGSPEIVPEEAEVLKKMFNLYLEGYSVQQIADYLNDNNIKSKKGVKWTASVCRAILSNEKYVGDFLMQKTYCVDCISKKHKKNNGELPQYLISNNHAPIIDRETFKLVQAEKAKRASKMKKSSQAITELGKYSSKYALSEILICGECGSHYRRRIKSQNGVPIPYWRCINRIDNGTKYCKKSYGIREEKLHKAICNAITKFTPDKEEILATVKASLEYAVSGNDKKLDKYNIETNIKQLQKDAEALMVNARTTEGDKERYYIEIQKIYDKVKVLREQLDMIKVTDICNDGHKQELERIYELFDKESFSLNEYDDIIVRRTIECIRVMSDKTISIIFKGGYEVFEKIE